MPAPIHMPEVTMACRPAAAVPRRPHARELPALERWLDRGLRRGEEGRLTAEYPLSMGQTGSRRHQVVYQCERFAAHAMSHVVTLRARGRRLRVGMVGNVYTDPDFRERGWAGRCVAASVEELRELGALIAVLWGEHTPLYARAGFAPAGREHFWSLSTLRKPLPTSELVVRMPRATDFPALETLYAAKPVRVERAPGALQALCSAPCTHISVAQRGTRVEGYAVAGRGDDFAGVVHEWAGSPEAVAACVDRLRGEAGAHTVMSGPVSEGFEPLLAAGGCLRQNGIFALVRILDVTRLWRILAPRGTPLQISARGQQIALRDQGERAALRLLTHAEALELLFGAGPDAFPDLSPLERRELSRVLPWPLYLWGLDSI